jgi:hypothetical protein
MVREEVLSKLKANVWPVVRPAWGYAKRMKHRLQSFTVPVDKLLRGGENEVSAARYAELTQDFLRPSSPLTQGPGVQFLREYDRIGDKILEPGIFEKTAYYRNAEQCMRVTGQYFVDDSAKLTVVAERFLREYREDRAGVKRLRSESDGEPVRVRSIRHSSYFELVDGNHRIARAIAAGVKSVPAVFWDREPVLTPLQSLLLDVMWIKGRKELYQPLDYPEIRENWKVIRKCTDRFSKMQGFLSQAGLLKAPSRTYLDVGSCYGWFVKRFEELGYQSFGADRDSIGSAVGVHCYGVRPEQIRSGDIGHFMRSENKRYDVVSLLSVLHHCALGLSEMSAEELIRLVDRITGRVLFFDTGEAHEEVFGGKLSKWTVPFIIDWLKNNTSFTRIIPLGKDEDRVPPYQRYYGRMLFACVRD